MHTGLADTSIEATTDPEAFLTVAQVADLVKVTRPTVYAMLAEGSLCCVRFRGVIRVQRSELDRYVREHSTAPCGTP